MPSDPTRLSILCALGLSALGCAHSSCPGGTEIDFSGRCLSVSEDGGVERRGADAGALYDDDPEASAVVIVEAPVDLQWIERGRVAPIAFGVSTAPAYYGPLTVELDGLPEGVAPVEGEDFAEGVFELEATTDARVGEIREVTLRAFATEMPELVGETAFLLAVRGARGTLDASWDGDGIRSDVPFDGTSDSIVQVALADDGRIVVGGNGRDEDGAKGFVSWYAEDGRPDPSMEGGATRQVEIVGETATAMRGILPTSDGVLVSVDASGPYVVRLDRDGNVDRRYAADASVVRPDELNGGLIHGHDDGFILSFNEQLERYHLDGSVDRAFGEDGVVVTTSLLNHRLAFFADGSIVRGTSSAEGRRVFTRLDPTGAPRLAFGTEGVAEIPSLLEIRGIAPLGDGGFVLVSNVHTYRWEEWAGTITRITPFGELDGDFGAAGEVVLDDGSSASLAFAGVAASGDRIYAWGVGHEGGANRGFVVAYTLGGELDPSFGDGGFLDLGDQLLPASGVVDEEAERLVLGGARRLSGPAGAGKMIAIARIWL